MLTLTRFCNRGPRVHFVLHLQNMYRNRAKIEEGYDLHDAAKDLLLQS